MPNKGIDVSSNQGKINWKQVKESGIEFAILRCHQKTGIDETFKYNYRQARANKIPIGVYKYSYALSVNDAKREANKIIRILKGKPLNFPVYYDIEDKSQSSFSVSKIERIALAFLKRIEAAGYKAAIYCNYYWYKTKISDKLKKNYDFWIASYPEDDRGVPETRLLPKECYIWQYSEKGRVPGISGDVDMDLLYPEKIKIKDAYDPAEFFTSEPAPETNPNSDEVIDGFTSGPKEETPQIQNGVKAEDVLAVVRSWLGLNESDGSHRKIVDIYNSHTPLAQGYRLTYYDSWCDATVSATFITLGATDLIGGTECGVERHIQLFKAKGIWIEDGSIVPKPGDIICYNWDDSTQPNDGFADHIGFVESCDGVNIITIEGNCNHAVRRVQIPVGYGYIRGFARPKYGNTVSPPAAPVVTDTSADEKKRTFLFDGVVTASTLNVRVWAGIEYNKIKSIPEIQNGKVVAVMDYTINDKNGEPWYYVCIDGNVFGFVKASYIRRV